MRRLTYAAPLAVIFVLATGASCDSKSDNATPPAATAETSVGTATSPEPTTQATKAASAAPPAWPSPEDCVSYNPGNVVKHYEAGYWAINDGTKQVIRVPGGPSEKVVDQALALAKRFKKHCFLGRNNTREEKYSYIFDYWMDSSGSAPSIPDENCSNYNKNNLTVEDMGSGHGWRVKDHDHVLHLFDKESDAKNGKLVIGKYGQICFIGNPPDGNEGQDLINYFK
jgi:hypothetical protein